MTWLRDVFDRLAALQGDWETLDLDALQFWHRETGQLALLALIVSTVVLLAWRWLSPRQRKDGLTLPVLFDSRRRDWAAWLRLTPLVPFVAGVPCLVVALSDPYSALVRSEASYPGRRISLMIDASTSMTTSFTTETLNTLSRTGPAFFTTVAAAERFVELRRSRRNRDVMALVEFGDRAYVITPFTSDYDNILLSIALIKDPVEFSQFPNRGTVISRALEQSLDLFTAFDFLDAAGNLMVIFTDGEDTTTLAGRSLDDILQVAIANEVPLYFVRTNYRKGLGELVPDQAWKAAVERTGGRFYAVSDEASLLRAIADIDQVAAGEIRMTHYTSQQPRFAVFAALGAALWTLAAALKLTIPYFQQLP